MDEWGGLVAEEFGYLTTTGRRTGRVHTIEIWFAGRPERPTAYMLAGSGSGADWVRNIRQNRTVTLRIGDRSLAGQGRIVADPQEEILARRLVVKKYYGRDTLQDSGWEVEALPVAVDLDL